MPVGVSVIVPNRDCALVGRTVEAVAAQKPAPIEIVVVGSDAPGALPRAEPVRFIESEGPLNAGEARNLGVERARGDLLVFTDADCAPRPGWLARLADGLERAPVVGGAVTFDLEANRWAVADNIASFHDLLADRPAEVDSRGAIGTLNLAVRRDAWAAVGGFDPELATSEDFDWVLRARAAGLATAFDPRALVEHAAVRASRAEVEGHAAWYGRHFPRFRARHPGVFDRGPTWRHRALFVAAAPLKARLQARRIFARHPRLAAARERAHEGVVAFYRAWYRAVAGAWDDV